jgi:hypothetical protein
LIDPREILPGRNRRYLAQLSALDDFSAGVRALGSLIRPRDVDGETVKGINFFDPDDDTLSHAPRNPRTNIAGVRRADLPPDLGLFSPTWPSRQLLRLPGIGVIKCGTGTYRCYLTRSGRLAELAIIPTLI